MKPTIYTLWNPRPRQEWLAAATRAPQATPEQLEEFKQRVLAIKKNPRRRFQTPIKAETYRTSFD
jgi:uncharacterized protein YecA (UPF0149 family)